MSQQKNNHITLAQWQQLMDAVNAHVATANWPSDVLYQGMKQYPKLQRYFCYDNLDRVGFPGLDFRLDNGENTGTLTVHDFTEQARAPITFEEGMMIARNFLNDEGGQMAEEIVCEWLMDGNESIF